MNLKILHPKVQQFIEENLTVDVAKLIFKGSPFDGITIQELATQIVSKKKSEKKLPSWFSTENIYYPPKLNIEQTSSEVAANYKASLISGNTLIDITGGFGVDCAAFSRKFKQITHCELNRNLSTITHHNYQQLEIKNVAAFSGDGIAFLKNSSEIFDCIYIDPSRRDDTKGKVFLLKDCLPNVPDNLDFLFSKTEKILIKNSPILDIKSTINELDFIKEIHIVAVQNEVKELLFLLQKNYTGDINIKTINFHKNTSQTFDFQISSKKNSQYSKPLTYLYEPNSAILKSGGFHQICDQFSVSKLHQHSHLYTSENLIEFPGRKFKIDAVVAYDKKILKNHLKDYKANITSRNFPETVAKIRKRTKIKDGGSQYLFFTTDINNKPIVLICDQLF